MPKRFRDCKIRDRLFTGFGVILFFLVSVSTYTIYSSAKIKTKSREVELRDFNAVDLSTGMKETVLVLEHIFSDIIITPDPKFLDELQIKIEKFSILTLEFREIVKDDPDLLRQLELLEADFKEYCDLGRNTIQLLKKAEPGTKEGILDQFHSLGGNLRKEIDFFQQEYVARLSQSLGEIDTMARDTQRINILLIGLTVLLTLLLSFFITRGIVFPIKKLVEATKRLSGGDLSFRVGYNAADELGILANSFNWMSENLQQSIEEIKQAAERWETTFNSIEDWIVLNDRDGKMVKVNKAFADSFKMEPEEFIGRNSCELIHGTKELLSDCPHRQAVETKKPTLIETFEPYLGIYLEVSVSPIFDEKGEVIRTVNIFKDITKRKNAEKELQATYEQLKEAQSQLIQAAKMEVVGTLASGVAHEVKNPLATILMGIEYLSKAVQVTTEDIRCAFENMRDAVKKADYIIRGLLDFSRVTQLDLSPQHLNPVVEQALALVRHECNKYHVEVSKDLKVDMPEVNIDRNKIEQVFVNLLLNAVQAMADGGRLTIRTYVRELTETEEGAGQRKEDIFRPGETTVIVEIEDTGTGIPEDILDKIFDPFFTTKRAKGGTGLGLSVVRSIIDLHNGKIKIANKKEGRGAIATVMFKITRKGV